MVSKPIKVFHGPPLVSVLHAAVVITPSDVIRPCVCLDQFCHPVVFGSLLWAETSSPETVKVLVKLTHLALQLKSSSEVWM